MFDVWFFSGCFKTAFLAAFALWFPAFTSLGTFMNDTCRSDALLCMAGKAHWRALMAHAYFLEGWIWIVTKDGFNKGEISMRCGVCTFIPPRSRL